MMSVNSVFCMIEGCKNTAHCRIGSCAICGPCLDSMASLNSENEAYVRAVLATAQPITDCVWRCEACGVVWDSFHIRNGLCLDCCSVMPLL